MTTQRNMDTNSEGTIVLLQGKAISVTFREDLHHPSVEWIWGYTMFKGINPDVTIF